MNHFNKILNPMFVTSLLLFWSCELNSKTSDAELRRGASIINKHYPKMLSSGKCRADRVSVYKNTLCFHYTSFISGTIDYQKAIFWPDVILRSKAKNLSKMIRTQGVIFHEYKNKEGKFLFLFRVTPEDLNRF